MSKFANYTKSVAVLLIFALAFSLGASNAGAAISPVSVGIVPPVQFPPSDFGVTGFRLSGLWGRHRDLYGLDLGLIGNITEQDFLGVALSGVFNMTRGTTTILGFQAAGLANINVQKTNVYGIQATAGVNSNSAQSKIVGVQFAPLANLSEFTTVYGVQFGLYNRAQDVWGLQIGLVNVANSLHGIQIGLANFHFTGTFYVSPIINVGF